LWPKTDLEFSGEERSPLSFEISKSGNQHVFCQCAKNYGVGVLCTILV